jgi:hypothetical protein
MPIGAINNVRADLKGGPPPPADKNVCPTYKIPAA